MNSDKYSQGPWDLGDLFPDFDSPAVQEALADLERRVTALEAARSELDESLEPERFVEIVDDYEALVRVRSRLLGYASLRFAADTQDQQAQGYLARFRQVAAEADNRIMFFRLWWKQLSAEQAAPYLAVAGDYRYWLEQLRLQQPYTLSEPEERIVNLKDVNGMAALITLMSTMTDRYEFELTVDGETHSLNREQLSSYYHDSDPSLRRAAYQSLFQVYGRDLPLLGQIYQARIRDWYSENVQVRGYTSPIAVRNLRNDVPDHVVDLLLEVCQQNSGLFQRYFRLKAAALEMDRLRRYDLYAPVAETDVRYEFGQAVDLVLGSFRRFDDRVADLAERVFAEGHLDSEVRAGKRGGAFCATITPDLTPYVLQTFQGLPRNVATMAHELGHAVHSMLAAEHSALTQRSALPLAETASTFGEMLVVDRILAEDADPDAQRALLFRQMDKNYGTIMRQAYFALFERQAHQATINGADLDELSSLYFDNLQDQFGEALTLSDEFRLEWVVIPHFYHTPFYVYAYAFGQLLVLSLYRQYQEEGERFKPRYLQILRSGGSAAPAEVLAQAGIAIESAEFWQGGFDVLNDDLDRLEALQQAAHDRQTMEA
ncbi:MAG: M3 family oligoendopeptidase [Candidatus Promineifilaceae bacterium]|nr:M3 family oligoendopeptidase [Candidatus Promineifilaceae bacterium]